MKGNYRYFWWILLIFFLALVANYPYHTNLTKISPNDSIFFFYIHEFIKSSMVGFHQFPNWIPYYFGGMPFFANAQSMVFTISGMLALIFSSEVAMNLTFIIGLFLAGYFMFLLVIEIGQKEKFAFVSAILYMFNGWIMHQVIGSGLERFSVYFWFPLILLFCIKSFNKDYIKYSILTGIIIALAFHGSGIDTFLWFCLLLGFFFIFNFLFYEKNKNNSLKILKIGIVIFVVFFGLTAIKFLPLLEFSKNTNKNVGFSLDDSFQQKLNFKDSIKMFVTKYVQISYPVKIGFVASILVFFSLFRIKNKYVLFLVLVSLISILICMSKTAYSFLWKFVPGFAAQHDVTRSLFLVAFSSSILASFGLSFLNDKFTSKFDKKIIITIYICIIIIILLELNIGLNFFQGNKDISFDFRKQISENYLLKNLSIDSGLFRIHNIGTNAIGGAAGSYAIPLKLQILYGYNNVWITDYFNEYLGIAHQSPTKFYGMLNTRWIYYNQELNVSGLRFVKKFDECQSCYDGDIDSGVDGPYLYYNEQYLPRAYLVDDAILILGDEKDVKKVGYYLMLDDNFDPSNNVIIFGKKSLKDYSLEYLKRFKIIVLSGSSITNVGDKEIAKNFVYSGGYIFPDITQEHFSSDTKDLIDALKKLKDKDKKESYKSVNEINITYYTPNRISFDTNNLRGFLVISEKFAMFDGWKTKNLEKEILRADGINSAIYLDGSEDIIEVLYKPKTFIYGSILFFITIICLIIYFIIDYRNKNRIDKNE